MDCRKFLRDVPIASGNDYPAAFKLLGMVVFVAEAGVEPLLSGRLVSVSTFNRRVDTQRLAGWGDLLTDVRLRQALREYLDQRLGGLPVDSAWREVVEAVMYIAKYVLKGGEVLPQKARREWVPRPLPSWWKESSTAMLWGAAAGELRA